MTTRTIRDRRMVTMTEASPDQIRQDLLRPWPRITVSAMLAIIFLIAFLAWGVNGTNAAR